MTGLFVAVIVFLYGDDLRAVHLREPAQTDVEETASVALAAAPQQPGASAKSAAPEPRFDFYKILPEMEVEVPQWELDRPKSDGVDKRLAEGSYVLQVGSYQRYEDADRAKANLALQGIRARIQRVVINGQDVWYRVHVGPYTELAEINAMRTRLQHHDLDFILLRLGDTT